MTRTDLPRKGDEIAIWIHTAAGLDSAPLIHEVVDELRALGASVTGPTDDLPSDTAAPDAVVAVLRSGAGPVDAELETRLASWRDRLIPLALGDGRAAEFRELGQLRLPATPPRVVARRIFLGASIGGAVLADLYGLEASARRWETEGRPRGALLRGRQLADGHTVLVQAGAESSSQLREYVTASAAHRRRRTRRSLIAAGTTVVMLAATAVIAAVQSRAAAQAAAASEAERAHTESVRLSRLAIDLIPLDPDLPWLLAGDALQQAVTPEAREAGQRVVSSGRPHRSIPLPTLPDGLNADPLSDRVAVHYVDGSVEVRSAIDGTVIARPQPAAGPTDSWALAPGGDLLFLSDASSDGEIVDVRSDTVVRRLEPADLFLGWVDPNRIVLGRGQTLTISDVGSGRSVPTDARLPAVTGSAWSVSDDGGTGYLAIGDTVVSVDLRSGRTTPALSLPGVQDITSSPDGSTALAAMGDAHPQLLTRADGALTATPLPGIGHRVCAAGGGWMLGDESGGISRTAAGQDSVSSPFLAHRGPLVGLGRLSRERLATVGGDQFLRVWEAPADVEKRLLNPDRSDPQWRAVEDFIEAGVAGNDEFSAQSVNSRESGRQMVGRDPVSGKLTYLLQNPQIVGQLDGESLEPVSKAVGLVSMTTLTRPVDGGRIAFFYASGWTAVLDLTTGDPVWSRVIGSTLLIPGLVTGASPTGEVLAAADSRGLRSWGAAGDVRSLPFERQEAPVAVLVDRSRRASAVTAAGRWYRLDESPVELSTPQGGSVQAAALGPDDALYFAQETGPLRVLRNGTTTDVAILSPDLDPVAIRVAGDSDLVAVVGENRTIVVSASSGATVLDVPAAVPGNSAIRDVAIAGSTVWAIRADYSVIRMPVLNDDGLRRTLRDAAPRAMTPEERAETADAVSVFGAR